MQACPEPVWCREYCATHYNQWRVGNLDEPFVPARKPAQCVIDDCDSEHIKHRECHFGDGKHRSKGLCSQHYFRQLRGTPLEPVRAKNFAKLTPDDVRQMRRMRSSGEPLRVVAARFGVSMCAVSAACTRRTWADVD